MKKINILLILSLLSFNSQGVITVAITKVTSNTNYNNYEYSLQRWDSNDSSPNPCYGLVGCMIGVFYYDKAGLDIPVPHIILNQVESLPTLGSLSTIWSNLGVYPPFPSQFNDNNKRSEICITVAARNFNSTTLRPVSASNTSCATAPPPIINCNVTGNLNLNHGSLPETELKNNRINKNLKVTCSDNASLSVSLNSANGNEIQLKPDGSLKSSIYINDKSASEIVKVKVSPNVAENIKISSILLTKGRVEPGPFHGSGTISISID